jgi:hypothetical protein
MLAIYANIRVHERQEKLTIARQQTTTSKKPTKLTSAGTKKKQ